MLRVMTGTLRPDHLGVPELAAGLAHTALKLAPDA
jgi:hypothetical protein